MYETREWQNREFSIVLAILYFSLFFLENNLFHDNSVMMVDTVAIFNAVNCMRLCFSMQRLFAKKVNWMIHEFKENIIPPCTWVFISSQVNKPLHYKQ